MPELWRAWGCLRLATRIRAQFCEDPAAHVGIALIRHRMEGVMTSREPLSKEETNLLLKQLDIVTDFYKFFFDWVLKLDVFYYTITGAITSFCLANPRNGLLRWSLVLPIILSILLFSLFWSGRKGLKLTAREARHIGDRLQLDLKLDLKYLPNFLATHAIMCTLVALGLSCLLAVSVLSAGASTKGTSGSNTRTEPSPPLTSPSTSPSPPSAPRTPQSHPTNSAAADSR